MPCPPAFDEPPASLWLRHNRRAHRLLSPSRGCSTPSRRKAGWACDLFVDENLPSDLPAPRAASSAVVAPRSAPPCATKVGSVYPPIRERRTATSLSLAGLPLFGNVSHSARGLMQTIQALVS